MNIVFVNSLIFSNTMLVFIVRELWKDNKKHKEVIKLQENVITGLNKQLNN